MAKSTREGTAGHQRRRICLDCLIVCITILTFSTAEANPLRGSTRDQRPIVGSQGYRKRAGDGSRSLFLPARGGIGGR